MSKEVPSDEPVEVRKETVEKQEPIVVIGKAIHEKTVERFQDGTEERKYTSTSPTGAISMAVSKRDTPENFPPDLSPEEMSRVIDFLVLGRPPTSRLEVEE